MAEDSSSALREQRREASRRRYAKNADILNYKRVIKYYRKKKENGEEWIPKQHSKIYQYCLQRGVDAKDVVEGTIPLPQ